jgi:hypothetical protein
MSDELITWLRAQIDEDERVALATTGGDWEVGPTFGAKDNRVYVKPIGFGIDTIGTCVIAGQVANMPEYRANAIHIARQDPDRTLREVAAKRRILDEVVDEATSLDMSVDGDRRVGSRDMVAEPYIGHILVKLMALPYAGQPGYREEWAL